MVLRFLTCVYISAYISSTTLAQHLVDHVGGPRLVAARKGDPPPCDTRPGQTFCEYVRDYPYDLVLNAIKNTKFDISKLLVDESTDDGPDLRHINPGPTEREKGSQFALPKDTSVSGNSLEDVQFEGLKHEFTYEEIHKRLNRIPRNATFPASQQNEDFLKPRAKRQNLDSLPPLCKFTARYVYPQVAMCARTGDWMYIINAYKQFGNLSQMIKTEICNAGVVGKPCTGACNENSLPFGIASQCNQHYVQKRLITFDGTEIATDMFWLPTCCICSTFRTKNPDLDNA